MKILILILLLSFILCDDALDQKYNEYKKCIKEQIGKPFSISGEGPDTFSHQGLVRYCRKQAGLSALPTIYISWKKFKEPMEGDLVYGIKKEYGDAVDTDLLGIVYNGKTNPITVISGSQGTNLHVNKLKLLRKYIRIEYIRLDLE